MGIPLVGGPNGKVRSVGCGYLRLPPPEHIRTIYCNQEHYVPVSGVGLETGATGLQAVVVACQIRCGLDVDGVGGGTDREGGG